LTDATVHRGLEKLLFKTKQSIVLTVFFLELDYTNTSFFHFVFNQFGFKSELTPLNGCSYNPD